MTLTVSLEAFPSPKRNFEESGPQRIVLGGGCFWCTEAVYLELEGVLSVTSGYAGDREALANYDKVCSGLTNHAEVIEIRYDSDRISLGELLQLFFSVAHDPTQLDRQGNDRGRQYRSVVFWESEQQRDFVRDYIHQLDRDMVHDAPIVTTLEPLEAFYPAEEYHQDFASRNPTQPYIQFAALPKVHKLREHFPEKLRGGGK